MEQERLFRLAVESGSVAFQHVAGYGWRLTIVVRRGDESWTDARSVTYDRLSTHELLDTMYAHLDRIL